jgi:hypothetical protein
VGIIIVVVLVIVIIVLGAAYTIYRTVKYLSFLPNLVYEVGRWVLGAT